MKLKSLLLIGAVFQPSVRAEGEGEQLRLLDAESFEVRQKAQDSLKAWLESNPDQASVALFKYYAKSTSPEVRSRIRHVLLKTESFHIHVVAKKYGVAQGFVGITMNVGVREIDGKSHAVVIVRSVHPGSPAELAGLVRGDAIWGVDDLVFSDHKQQSPEQFKNYVGKVLPGNRVTLNIVRDAIKHQIPVQLTARYLQLSKPDRLPIGYQRRRDPEMESAREKVRYFELWLNGKLKE